MEITKETQQATYEKILGLMDVGDAMFDEVENDVVLNKQQLAHMIVPVVEQVERSIGTVANTYLDHVEDGGKANDKRSMAVDMAMKEIYDALYVLKSDGEKLLETLENGDN